jgi:hypothetical protein
MRALQARRICAPQICAPSIGRTAGRQIVISVGGERLASPPRRLKGGRRGSQQATPSPPGRAPGLLPAVPARGAQITSRRVSRADAPTCQLRAARTKSAAQAALFRRSELESLALAAFPDGFHSSAIPHGYRASAPTSDCVSRRSLARAAVGRRLASAAAMRVSLTPLSRARLA